MKQAAACLQVVWRAAGARGDKLRIKSSACKTFTRGCPRLILVSPRGKQPQLHCTTRSCGIPSACPADAFGWQTDRSASMAAYLQVSPFGVLSELPGQFVRVLRLGFARQPLADAGGLQETGQRRHQSAFCKRLGLYESYRQCADKVRKPRTKISMTGPFHGSLA